MDRREAHHEAGFPAPEPTEQNGGGGGIGSGGGSAEMVDYMLNASPVLPQALLSLDRLSFAEVMQFADFRSKLGLPQVSGDADDEGCFFKFPSSLPCTSPMPYQDQLQGGEEDAEEEEARLSDQNVGDSSVREMGGGGGGVDGNRMRRKRARSIKTSEEVESQRMTHIAVERNRRRQMNDHLHVLRSLMPSSYVQRGDQASIIGGAIEFVRELEQLLQCLESQKRRRIYGSVADASLPLPIPQLLQSPPLPLSCIDPTGGCGGLVEEMAENRSALADIEVRMLGADAMIKILSRRRAGQLLRTIAALEDMQLTILHTNITTIEQTVLYSFNVKMAAETSCTAQEIANSVQQILDYFDTSIHQY
ncbi:Transcription factor FAMA [Platanthera guangdongensis]|uniref:Transcription factor FAMA n=1 Tax=Platanthera guangdongensis TaxID=2320717 RepID=A0ABR2M202_9ASPA